jgi:hypothetical protein
MITKLLSVMGEIACLKGTETLNILNTILEFQYKITCLSHKDLQIVVECQQNSFPHRLIALKKMEMITSLKFFTITGKHIFKGSQNDH